MACVFEHGIKCVALTEKRCEGCSFRKTKEEAEEGRKRARRRISSLSREQQIYIYDKYYGKGKVWEL